MQKHTKYQVIRSSSDTEKVYRVPILLLFLRPFTNVDSLSVADTPMGKKLAKKG